MKLHRNPLMSMFLSNVMSLFCSKKAKMDGMISTAGINLSVVLLYYGAGRSVYGFVDKTRKLLENNVPSWEIILVGNYFEKNQDDNTPAVVKDIASKDTRIKAIVLPKKGMVGWDV